MKYCSIVGNGSARDEALKRRNGAVRQALGIEPKPEPIQEPDKAAEQKAGEKPSEPAVSFPPARP